MINPFYPAHPQAKSTSHVFHSAHSSQHAKADQSPIASRISMSQITTSRWSFLEDVVNYQRAGIHRIAIWRPKLNDFGEELCAEVIRDTGMRVSSLGWAGGFTGVNGHSYLESVHDTRSAIMTAASLGAESVTIISGPQGAHIDSHCRRLLVDGLAECLDVAGEFGVTLALQPMHRLYHPGWTFLHSLDETLDLLTEIDHPCLKMAFGTYHLWPEPDLLDRLPSLVPMIATVQISDWKPSPQCDNDHAIPGDGVLPLAEILQTLHESGYQGSYEVEVLSRDLWKSQNENVVETCRERLLSMMKDTVSP